MTTAAFPPPLQNILFTPPVLESLTCRQSQDELRRILIIPESQQPLLRAYRASVCNRSASLRADYFRQLAVEMKDQLEARKVAEQVRWAGQALLWHPSPQASSSCPESLT